MKKTILLLAFGLLLTGCRKQQSVQTDAETQMQTDVPEVEQEAAKMDTKEEETADTDVVDMAGQDTETQGEEVQDTEVQSESETGLSDTGQEEEPDYTLPQAGLQSMENLLYTAKQPVGTTMYIWGGGWNEEDTGAGIEAVSIGVSPAWASYAAAQDASYNYKNTRYQIHNGLDCSGYIGWLVYNVFHTKDQEMGYVQKATTMAEIFAGYGWGSYTPAGSVTDWQAGDIMSMKGHVWMSLGMCEDGSVLLMHASPPGVRISGTRNTDGSDSQAVDLARKYMSSYYPDWYNRYPECGVDHNYLDTSAQMRWSDTVLSDESGIRQMTAEEVCAFLFE